MKRKGIEQQRKAFFDTMAENACLLMTGIQRGRGVIRRNWML